MTSNLTYLKFARYYDAYVRGFQEDLPLYHPLCNPGERILEVGCGTGRVLRSFLESGFPITGVDISPEMLAIAAAKLNGFTKDGQLRLINHNFAAAGLPGQYQRILVTFYTFNYLLTEPEALSFLTNIRHTMENGALLIMDLFYPSVLSHPEDNRRWVEKRFQNEEEEVLLRDIRILNGNMEERTQCYTEPEGTTEITTIRRYYPKTEIMCLLKEAGYRNILLSDGYRVDGFHPPAFHEETTTGFMVRAKK